MEALPEELILEIFSKLPLKYSVQCKVLNKNFNFLISNLPALRSNTTSDCLLHYSPTNPCAIISKVHLQSHDKVQELARSSSSSMLPTILSSSGGLLLLWFNSLCVFNPFTGTYRFVPSSPKAKYFGLASQLTDPSCFELVAVCTKFVENKTFYQFYIFDSETSNWTKSITIFTSTTIPTSYVDYQTAYVDDSFYWLKTDGKILVFNVKKKFAKIISLKKEGPFSRTWFGVCQDKLSIAIPNGNKISIYFYVYDSVSEQSQWKIDKLLEIPSYFKNVNEKFYLLFYDGRRLFYRETGKKELHMYDLEANSLKRIKTMQWWCDSVQTFRYYFGTLAKIPHCNYLQESGGYMPESLKILVRFRKYLLAGL